MSNTARSLLSSVRIVRMISPSIVLTASRSPQPMNMLTPLLLENMIDLSGSWTCEKRNSQRPGILHVGLRAVEKSAALHDRPEEGRRSGSARTW